MTLEISNATPPKPDIPETDLPTATHYRMRYTQSTVSTIVSPSREGEKAKGLTIPVSLVRCCDWKKTASFSPHVGQGFWIRGN